MRDVGRISGFRASFWFLCLPILSLMVFVPWAEAQRTSKPPLHGRHWVAITGKPLGATAGAMAFQKRRQRRGRSLRHVGGHVHHVGHPGMGR